MKTIFRHLIPKGVSDSGMKPIRPWIDIAFAGLLALGVLSLVLLTAEPWLPSGSKLYNDLWPGDILSSANELKWKDATFQVFPTGEKVPVSVRGKIGTLRTNRDEWKQTVFVTGNGRVWIGWKGPFPFNEQFYIETHSGVLGVDVHSEFISWQLIETDRETFHTPDIDTVIHRLEQENNLPWEGHSSPGLRKTAGNIRMSLLVRENDPRWMALPYLTNFELARTGDAIHLAGNTLRLELQIDGKIPATVWMDVETRKLLMATEDGQQVFPKSFWQTMRDRIVASIAKEHQAIHDDKHRHKDWTLIPTRSGVRPSSPDERIER